MSFFGYSCPVASKTLTVTRSGESSTEEIQLETSARGEKAVGLPCVAGKTQEAVMPPYAEGPRRSDIGRGGVLSLGRTKGIGHLGSSNRNFLMEQKFLLL